MSRQTRKDRLSRRTVIKSAGVGGITLVAGCISSTNPNKGDSGSTNESKETGTGAKMAGSAKGWSWDVAAKALQATANSYEEDTNGSIAIKQMGNDTVHQQLRTALISGTGAPDFSSILTTELPSYIQDVGGFQNLSGRIKETGIKDKFVDARWPPATGPDGNIYALPWDISPAVTFYRRDVYEKYGINPKNIETWNQFIEAGTKLPDDIAMINIDQQTLGENWRMYYWQQGRDSFTQDGKINFANEASINIARKIKQAYDAGVASNISVWSPAWFAAFKKGKTISIHSGSWMAGTLRAELSKTAGKWGVYKLPAFKKGGNRASNRGGTHHMIPKQTDDEAAQRAWDYMKYTFTQPEMQLKLFEISGIFPGLKTAWDSPVMDEKLDFFNGQRVRQVYVNVAPQIPVANTITPYTPVVKKAIRVSFQKMLRGKLTPKEAVQDAAETVAEKTNKKIA